MPDSVLSSPDSQAVFDLLLDDSPPDPTKVPSGNGTTPLQPTSSSPLLNPPAADAIDCENGRLTLVEGDPAPCGSDTESVRSFLDLVQQTYPEDVTRLSTIFDKSDIGEPNATPSGLGQPRVLRSMMWWTVKARIADTSLR